MNIFDKFCVLSLAYRNNGFITTLAPLRDYLSPHDPTSSAVLCATKARYFTRLSVAVRPSQPKFREAQWVGSEDVNVEHLLDVFTSIDTNSSDLWNSCICFMQHLYWHKPRETVLGSKIEDLPDNHPFKPTCLYELSSLFESVGNHVERKRLLTHILTLSRKQDAAQVALTLRRLSNTNRWPGFHKEGIQQAKEASKIYERPGDAMGLAWCLNNLAWLFLLSNQFDAAQDVPPRTIRLISEKDDKYLVCQSHRVLGNIHHSKGEKEQAIHHFKTALEIALRFDWQAE